MPKKNDANDPRYHYEIWSGPSSAFGNNEKSIYYVENHNAQCGYAELALDFGYALDALIEQAKKTNLGNWTAPIAHMSRQLIELQLKALMEEIKSHDSSLNIAPLGGHSLEGVWNPCRNWLIKHDYRLLDDSRLEMTDQLILAFHEIDPLGDLFRFGISRKTAFKKQKSYDRVGIELKLFEQELYALRGLVNHWEAVLFRETIKLEMGWDKDPHFDPDNFPKKPY